MYLKAKNQKRETAQAKKTHGTDGFAVFKHDARTQGRISLNNAVIARCISATSRRP
jgi:hypothetical protein